MEKTFYQSCYLVDAEGELWDEEAYRSGRTRLTLLRGAFDNEMVVLTSHFGLKEMQTPPETIP